MDRVNQRLYSDCGHGLWLLQKTGEFVGNCGLTPQQVDDRSYIEVGYHVKVALQGEGLATEAATACRRYAGERLGSTTSSRSSTQATNRRSAWRRRSA